jgi:hypothetical protein
MPKRNNGTLKLSHVLYNPEAVDAAVVEFADSAEIAVSRHADRTDVSFVSGEDKTVLSEFANYALFLTIQSR